MREFILKQRLARGISYKLENDVACPSCGDVAPPCGKKKNWESQGGSLSERQTLCYGTQQILGLPGIFPHDFPSFSFAFVQLEPGGSILLLILGSASLSLHLRLDFLAFTARSF